MKLVNRLKEQTGLLPCFRYKGKTDYCHVSDIKNAVTIAGTKSVYLDTPQLSFLGCADSVATLGRMTAAAIDIHGDSRGDASAARGIHKRRVTRTTATAPLAAAIITQTSHISTKKAMTE
jgi:hypothetical protein